MSSQQIGDRKAAAAKRAKSRKSVWSLSGIWQRVRKPIQNSAITKAALVSLFKNYLGLIRVTTRPVAGSVQEIGDFARMEPFILALWHGQHIIGPLAYPGGRPLVALFSRSADAELNARVAEKMGMEVVRGSGGRAERSARPDKGGAKALIQLKRALDDGKNVTMIADIPHGTPREAGQGIILLASISGRPILPVAITTSRRTVLERTWDKTTINLPFGRRATAVGEPIYVPPKADQATLEERRQALTAGLNDATVRAAALVDKPS